MESKMMPRWLSNNYGVLIIISMFFSILLISGMLYSFGVMFPVLQEEFHISSTVTSWIGSINYALLCGGHPMSLRLIDLYGYKYMMFVGIFLTSGGILVSSFAPHPAVLFLSFNLLFGYGCNVIYNVCVGLLSLWYPGTKTSRAFSLTLVASPIGYLLFNPILEQLIMEYGWRRTFRIMTALNLLLGLTCVTIIRNPDIKIESLNLIKHRSDESTEGKNINSKMIEKKEKIHIHRERTGKKRGNSHQKKKLISNNCEKRNIIQSPLLWLWLIENILIYLGMITPFIHLVNYLGMNNVSVTYGAFAVTIIGMSEACTRLLTGVVATAFNFHVIHYYPVATILLAITVFYLSTVTSFNMVIIYSIITGLAYGPITISSYIISRDLFHNSTQIAWIYTGFAQMIGSLLGSPLAGIILDMTGSYEIVFYINGGLYILCTILALILSISYRHMNRPSLPLSMALISKMTPDSIVSQLVITERVSVV